MTPLFTGEDVSINGIVLNRIDESGCKWALEDIDGWWSLPDPEIFEDPRTAYEDGNYYASGRYSPREITITGRILPPADGHMPVVLARNALNNALNMVRETGVLEVLESPYPKRARVQVSGRPLTSFNTAANYLEFSIPLRASDPRKFSVEQYVESLPIASPSVGRVYNRVFPQTYGQVGHDGKTTITNLGNYTTTGVFRIFGPVDQPVLRHIGQGKTLAFDTRLNQGDYLDVDLQAKTAIYKGGRPGRSALLPSSAWFSLEAGDNVILFSGSPLALAREYSPELRNLVLNPTLVDFDAEGNIDGSTITGPAATGVVIEFNGPDNSRNVRYTRTNTGQIRIAYGDTADYASTLVPGNTYNVSAYIKANQNGEVNLKLTTPGGTTGPESGPLPLTGGEWTRVSFAATADTGQTTGTLAILWQAISPGFTDAAGNTLEVASLQITEGTPLWPYFDGDDPFASWLGTPYASVSYQPEMAAVSAPVVQLTYRDAWIY